MNNIQTDQAGKRLRVKSCGLFPSPLNTGQCICAHLPCRPDSCVYCRVLAYCLDSNVECGQLHTNASVMHMQ